VSENSPEKQTGRETTEDGVHQWPIGTAEKGIPGKPVLERKTTTATVERAGLERISDQNLVPGILLFSFTT